MVVAGCDRNVEPFVPGEKPSIPDLARIFPPQQSQQKEFVRKAAPPAASPGSASAGPPLVGVVSLAPGAQPPAGAVLFVIARREGSAGPPLAVVRAQDPTFPYAFELSQRSVMMPNTVFSGPMRLTARLDSDGNAITREAGDLEAALAGAVVPGASDVELVLSVASASTSR